MNIFPELEKSNAQTKVCSLSVLIGYFFHFVMDQYDPPSHSAGVGLFFVQILILIKIILEALKSLHCLSL